MSDGGGLKIRIEQNIVGKLTATYLIKTYSKITLLRDIKNQAHF